MGVNLDSSRGLIVGEAVMMGIAPFVGRNAAHDIVYAGCKDCIEEPGSTLYDHLVKRAEVTDKISPDELSRLCDPRNYLGAAQRMVDDVIQRGGHAKVAKFKPRGIHKANGNVQGSGIGLGNGPA
jgi:3-carboxy-cis,cis-muconate cycloisomerase